MINEFERKMKTRQIWGIFPLAAMALMMGACGDDDILNGGSENGEQVEFVPMTFKAEMAQTRTELSGTMVNWKQGDVISILNLGEDAQQNCQFTTQDNGSSATFTGEAPEADAYLAVYPYQEGITGDYDGNSTRITLNGLELKSEQQAVAGSFDPNAHFAAGYVSSKNGVPTLILSNLCALVKFRIDGDQAENVTAVVLSGQSNETLAAESFSVAFPRQAVNLATFSDQAESSTSIRLLAPEGGFEPQTDYFFVALPGELQSGIKLEFILEGGSSITKTSTTAATLKPNYILNLGKITVGKLPDAKITNTDFIKAIGDQVDWTVAEDGTVTLDADNLAKVEAVSYLTLTNKGLTKFENFIL